jgi:uncharacterized protein (DUF433 family)
MNAFPNIVSNPAILKGQPCIAGTRISVEKVMEWFTNGKTAETIAEKHPTLTVELVREAIQYAARFL